MSPKLQVTETTMVLMMREVLTVKVSNTHVDVTTRLVISRAWYTLVIPFSSKSHTTDLVDELLDESFRKLGFHNAQSVVFTSVSDNGSNMETGLSAGTRY